MVLDVVHFVISIINAISLWRFLLCSFFGVSVSLFAYFELKEISVALIFSLPTAVIGIVLGWRWQRAYERSKSRKFNRAIK
jgi:predicted membrane chloride channel (bestrophin family)